MAGKKKSSKKARKHEKVSKLLERPEKLIQKVGKYVRKGKSGKLDALVKDSSGTLNPLILSIKDSHGQTLLHTACQQGHADVVDVLLSLGASTEEQDHAGNTPAHLAALHSHAVCVMKILQCDHPPDIDVLNRRGQTLRHLVQASLPQDSSGRARSQVPRLMLGDGTPFVAGEGDWSAGVLRGMTAREAVEHFRAQRGGRNAEEEAWQQRLREECSSDLEDWKLDETFADDPGTYWSGVGGSSIETEDEWADRMWREMQEKRRQKAAAERSAFVSAAAAARMKEQAAAAQAARTMESERILQREKARDAEWRQKASSGELFMEAARASMAPLDPAAALAAYQAGWNALMVRLRTAPMGKPLQLGVQDIAWPLPEGHAYTSETLGDVLLLGVQGPADIKVRLREELIRWHPDKFAGRLGPHVADAAAPAVRQRVKEVAQALTALMAGGSGAQ